MSMSHQLLTTMSRHARCSHDHWDGPGAWWPIFPILWLLS